MDEEISRILLGSGNNPDFQGTKRPAATREARHEAEGMRYSNENAQKFDIIFETCA